MGKKKVLIIDDELFIRQLIKDFFEFEEVECYEAEDASKAMALFESVRFDLIILDWNLGIVKSQDLATDINNKDDSIPIILLTGDRHVRLEELQIIGVRDIIYKPFQIDEFMNKTKRFLEN